MWEALNSFYLSLGRYDLAAAMQTGPYSVYQEVKERCALFWGLVDRTMLRDDGRAFLEAGGRIEQADMVLRMLLVTVPAESAHDGHESEAIALLHSVGGAQAYRRAVRDAPTVVPVVRFLLYDGSYPGSVASSVAALRDALSRRRRAAALLAAGATPGTADRRPRAPAPDAPWHAGFRRDTRPGTGRARADRPRHRGPLLRDRSARRGPSLARAMI